MKSYAWFVDKYLLSKKTQSTSPGKRGLSKQVEGEQRAVGCKFAGSKDIHAPLFCLPCNHHFQIIFLSQKMLEASSKRRKLSREPAAVTFGSGAEKADNPHENSDSGDEGDFSEDDGSRGSEDETALSQQHVKSKKTQKRKRRATSPSQFGSTLLSLLSTETPSNQPLSLQPAIGKHERTMLWR